MTESFSLADALSPRPAQSPTPIAATADAPLTDPPPPLRRGAASRKRPHGQQPPLPSAYDGSDEPSPQCAEALDFGGWPVPGGGGGIADAAATVTATERGDAGSGALARPPVEASMTLLTTAEAAAASTGFTKAAAAAVSSPQPLAAGDSKQKRPRRQASAPRSTVATAAAATLPPPAVDSVAARTRRRRGPAADASSATAAAGGAGGAEPSLVNPPPSHRRVNLPSLQRSAPTPAAAVPPPQSEAIAGMTSAGAAIILRCISDLERAVAHLRERDPTAAATAAGAGATAAGAEAAAVGGSPVAAASNTDDCSANAALLLSSTDPSLGCGKGGRGSSPAGGGSGGMAASAAGGIAAAVATAAAAGTDGPWGSGPSSNAGGGRSVFAALARSVVYQQLATNAASAIWGRVLTVCQASSGDVLMPTQVLAAPPEQMRAAGLSGRKLEYLRGLAEAFSGRQGWDEQLAATSDLDILVSELTSLRGVGSWTVHMLAMFHLGLPDVLPSGDLGVRRGLQLLHGLSALPEPKQVEALTEAWRPYRSVGSWYMWRIPPPPRNGGGTKKAAAAAGKKTKAG